VAPLLDEEELLAVGLELGWDRLLELDVVLVVAVESSPLVLALESSPLVTAVVVAGVLEVVVEVVVVLWW
jgi:hypothetical protein